MTYNEQYSLSKGDNHYDNQTSENIGIDIAQENIGKVLSTMMLR